MSRDGRKTGGGSRKGIPNKATADLKEMILTALDGAGGAEYYQRQADENPSAFMTLVGKVLPLQVTGKDGGAVKFEDVTEDTRPPIDHYLTEFMAVVAAARAGSESDGETKH